MKSIYKVVWSDEALQNLEGVIDYLEHRWTKREISKFSQLLDHQLKLIEENSYLFPKSISLRGLRKSVLSRQTTIYYGIDNRDVRVISLFDSRQNPKRIRF